MVKLAGRFRERLGHETRGDAVLLHFFKQFNRFLGERSRCCTFTDSIQVTCEVRFAGDTGELAWDRIWK